MAEVTTTYSVDVTTAPLPEDAGDIDALVEAVADEVYKTVLAAAIGGDMAERTIGITATVAAPSHLVAAERVLEVFELACRRAGLVDGGQWQTILGAINVTPSALVPAA